VAGAFPGDVTFGEAAQLVIDDREEGIEGGAVSFPPFYE
jgi:hypothetical protein